MEFERKEMLPVGPLDNVADMVGLSQLLAKMTLFPLLKIVTYSIVHIQSKIQPVHIMTLKSLLNHIKWTTENGNDPW